MPRRFSRSAVFAVALLVALLPSHGRSAAADLGGDCCADLEARIAELEATVARAGNRRMAMTISGQVHQMLLAWDDGRSADVYVTDPTLWTSFIEAAGEGRVSDRVTIGYTIGLELATAESGLLDQFEDDGPNSVEADSAFVYVDHSGLGRLTFGYASEAHDGVAGQDLSGSGLVASPAVTDWNGSFFLRAHGQTRVLGLDWSDVTLADEGDGGDNNLLRYETPELHGFVLSASWGEDDIAAVAARYEGEWNSFAIAAAIGYADEQDDDSPCQTTASEGKCTTLAGSISVLHGPTGLSVTLAAGSIEDGNRRRSFPDLDGHDAWRYGKLAYTRNHFGLGDTAIYAEYYTSDRGIVATLPSGSTGLAADFVTNDVDVDVLGAGVEQAFAELGIDAYAAYRRYEATISGRPVGGGHGELETEAFDAIAVGMRVPF